MGDLSRTARLADLFCRMARERFTGVLYAEHDEAGGVFSLRDGQIVFAEDPTDERGVADLLLEKQLLSAAQYAEIAAHVIESGAENEDAAFCEHAIRLGVLTRRALDIEIGRIVSGRVIQAIDWDDCRIEIDPDPDALAGVLECPQQIGPLVHIGVRTFFDEDRVRATIGRDGDVYVRLLATERELCDVFGLDEQDRTFLGRLRADTELEQQVRASGSDPLEAWQLICTLALAHAVQLGSSPFSQATEPSGVRATNTLLSRRDTPSGDIRGERGRDPSQGKMRAAGEEAARPGSYARMPAAREEVVRPGSQARMPAAREEAPRPGSYAGIPAVREEVVRPSSQGRMPAARADAARPSSQDRMAAAREQAARRGSQGRMAAARAQAARTGSQGRKVAAHNNEADHAERPQRLASALGPQPTAAARDAAEPSQALQRARVRPRKLSTALKRLDRELKQLRAQPTVPSSSAGPAARSSGAPDGQSDQSSYARARVEQLMRMRAAKLQQGRASEGDEPGRAAQEAFHSAQKELHDQQFARAHELLRSACQAEPDNQVYSMYCMYAALRANVLPNEDVNKLRMLLRDKISDDVHKAFAYYALGHIAMHEKKDDAAEKFFQKACDLNRHNKDAERYLRVLELRRKTAAENEKRSKIFGIEIGLKKS